MGIEFCLVVAATAALAFETGSHCAAKAGLELSVYLKAGLRLMSLLP